jgi:hypothetical protein
MQDFFASLALSPNVSSPTTSNDLKTQVAELVARAYYNLHGTPIAATDQQWATAMVTAATQLMQHARVQALSNRDRIHLFETMLRVSIEHQREAKRHASMATNVFYLKETVLDNAAHEINNTEHFKRAAVTVLGGLQINHTGKLQTAPDKHDS